MSTVQIVSGLLVLALTACASPEEAEKKAREDYQNLVRPPPEVIAPPEPERNAPLNEVQRQEMNDMFNRIVEQSAR